MQMSPDMFRAIVLEHQSMVYSIAVRLLNEPGTAEEVAQDVFLELHRAAARIDSPEHLVSGFAGLLCTGRQTPGGGGACDPNRWLNS